MKTRYESFGGIIFTENPELTVFVDKQYLRELGYAESGLWLDDTKNYLTAPINAHFNLTNKCSKNCEYCYNQPAETDEELSTRQVKNIIDVLSQMNVFSVAFGGGEPFLRRDIFEIAAYARKKNIVPTITTNGLHITNANVNDCRVFDHIHVSAELTEDGTDLRQSSWHKAILLLKETSIGVGINFVVDKHGFECLEQICKYARVYKIQDIMFLRFKPFGRARQLYDSNKLSAKQNKSFFNSLKTFTCRYKIRPMIDCSFLPMICCHKPNKKKMDFWAAQGCQGGNYIVEINADGKVRSCSFCSSFAGNAESLSGLWVNSSQFVMFRDWTKSAPPPCSSCDYLDLCRGGCHCIAETLAGDFYAPDPECPLVMT